MTPERRTVNPYDFYQGGFMPNCLMETTCVSPAAKVCYIALSSFAGKGKDTCWPSQEKLAERYGAAKRSTQEHLKELVDHGFIRIKQNGLRQANTYEFFSLEDWVDPISCVAEIRTSGVAESAIQDTRNPALPETRDSALPIPIDEPLSYEPLSKPFQDGTEETAIRTQTPEPKEQLDLEDPLIDERGRGFLRNAYNRTKRPKPKFTGPSGPGLVTRLNEAEDRVGRKEFRRALLMFLSHDDQFARTKSWAPWLFLERLKQDDYGASWKRPRPQPLLENCPILDNLSKPPEQPAESEVHRLIQLWNSGVPARAYSDPERYIAVDLEKTQDRAVMVEKIGDLIAKAAAIVKTDPTSTWLDLRWLCRDKDGYPNWRKLLSGALDFKASQRGRGGGKSELTVESVEQYWEEKNKKREFEARAKELNLDVSTKRF